MTQLTRRDFLRRTALGAAALALPSFKAAKAAGKPRPNVLFVLLDDLGYGQFGPDSGDFTMDQVNPMILERFKGKIEPEAALEAAKKAVPNISKLTAEGTRFTDAYVSSPLCAPSRTGIMTAKCPERFGCYVNLDVSKEGVPIEEEFLAGRLQKAGYATAAIGKWHLAAVKKGEPVWGKRHPLDCGFDSFFGFNDHSCMYYDSKTLWRDREPAKAEGFTTDQFTSEALGFIRKSKAQGKPFFVYLAYNAVHGPLNRPAPEQYRVFNTGNPPTDTMYSYLYAADAGVGRIRAGLEKLGLAENTLIIVMSDNGAPGSPLPNNGPFQGYKGQTWQGGLRVPMIAWKPGLVPAGKVCGEVVSSMDVLPTALDAAGVAGPGADKIDGRSLIPLFEGKQQGPVHETLFWAGQLAWVWSGKIKKHDELTAPAAWAVRKGKWMLHYWSESASYELYDVEQDKGERKNVAEANPEVVKVLRAEYAAWFKGLKKPVVLPERIWQGLVPQNS